MSWKKDLERHLKDDEFALKYAEEQRKSYKIIQRAIYSKWSWFWRLYYRW